MEFLCKKDYLLKHYWKKSEKVFVKGEYYICKKVLKPVSGPKYLYGITEQLLAVLTKDNRIIYFGLEKGKYEFYKDYFITNIEIRKKKLEKIHNFSMILNVQKRISEFYKLFKDF